MSPRWLLGECCALLDIYAASIGVETELALVEDGHEYALRTERPALARLLAALRVWVPAIGDEVEEAARAWHFERLPEATAECVDLAGQSWREAEMLACARLRLLIADGAFEPARKLAAALRAMAAERGLVRTEMRGLALSMVLEHRAGEATRARAHAVDWLRRYAHTNYGLALAREPPSPSPSSAPSLAARQRVRPSARPRSACARRCGAPRTRCRTAGRRAVAAERARDGGDGTGGRALGPGSPRP